MMRNVVGSSELCISGKYNESVLLCRGLRCTCARY